MYECMTLYIVNKKKKNQQHYDALNYKPKTESQNCDTVAMRFVNLIVILCY